jgi:hypothetical protein
MPRQHEPPHANSEDMMAEVLAETVAEISDDVACRQSLGFAGFTDAQITEDLWIAQFLARRMRAAEIERLYAAQFEAPGKLRHG